MPELKDHNPFDDKYLVEARSVHGHDIKIMFAEAEGDRPATLAWKGEFEKKEYGQWFIIHDKSDKNDLHEFDQVIDDSVRQLLERLSSGN